MAWHFAVSENPIIFSGEQILMNGNPDFSAIFAANAVLPLFGGPIYNENQNWMSKSGIFSR